MSIERTWRALLRVLFAVALLALAAPARADDTGRRAGTVRLVTVTGGRGPVELRERGGAYAAELSIVNDGKEPLIVSRVAVRGDASDPRVPPKLVARIVDGSLPVTIAPGASRKASVTWTPEPRSRQRQLFGHVVVTTSDESSGEVAMGVRAQISGYLGPLESHVLSLLLGAPLVGALVTLLLGVRRGGLRSGRIEGAVASVALGVQLAFAAYVYRGFGPDVSRADGNDGLQFVEHAVWIRSLGAEIHLGVDGIGGAALFVVSAVTFLAVLLERERADEKPGYLAGVLVLDAAALGVVCAMDGLLFALFATVAVGAAVLLVGGWGGAARRAVAIRLSIAGAFAVTLLAIAIVLTARHSEPTFLVDGTKVATSFNLPELSRAALGTKELPLLGSAVVKVAFVFVLTASLVLLAAFPAHRWLVAVLAEAPPTTGILVATTFPTIGLCAFLRIGCAVLPEGMRWASGVVVALGAVSAAYGALSALAQTELRRMAAAATTVQAGFVFLGAGSLTPQGLSGAIVVGATRALACGVFLLLAARLEERASTTDRRRLGGLAAKMPGWTTALAIAALAQAGVLGIGGAWGPVLALIGALSSYAPLAIVSAIALVVLAAAHLSALSRIAFGAPDPTLEPSELDALPGREAPLFDLTPREWTSVAPLVLLVVLLGLWPLPVVHVTTGTVRDLANAVSPPGPDKVAAR